MNLDHIEAFVFVIHYGSFNKAADALFLSQPSVSARIQALERELDCELFDRSGKKIHLTEKGELFLPYAQEMLQSFRKGKQRLRVEKSPPSALRIGSAPLAAGYLLPGLLPALLAMHPDVHLTVTTASSDEILDKVLNKELDIGFVRGLAHHPGVQSVRFYDDPIRLYAPPGHPFLGAEDVSLEEVANESIIQFECTSLDWLRVQRLFDRLASPPTAVYRVDNLETAKRLVMEGAGIAFLPELSVRQEAESGRIGVARLAELDGIALRTNLISLVGEHGPYAKSLRELAQLFVGAAVDIGVPHAEAEERKEA
ncbi:LysR family transcriptional regulator [Cohnella sp. REN36]|uniref:LysR family transcriptional regulator n=1 Tax=Cohnella sp. REN36 TaxID=2887347 RepID=UPI001D13EC3E|nr:LysR family transcriptional regulator [Cohnella sp. REN36]MCC3373120.1 LysR family transcriptional regulator [Cohnella sp. REN36]